MVTREDEEGGWWCGADSDIEVSDCRVCNAAIWVGLSERRSASMAEGGGGVWGSGSSIGDESEGEPRSRISHCWRSVWRLVRKMLLVVFLFPLH